MEKNLHLCRKKGLANAQGRRHMDVVTPEHARIAEDAVQRL